MSATDQPFWQRKGLAELSEAEWEALCDGCGRCCLVKLEDADTGELHQTRLTCRLLDLGTCRCTDYANRHQRVADCLTLTADTVRDLSWLPQTCAYRLLDEGRDLAWWHPLISGDPETVHAAGISVRGWAKSEAGIPEDRLYRYVSAGPGPGRDRSGTDRER